MSIRFETRPTSLLTKLAMFASLALLGGLFGYVTAKVVDLQATAIGWDDSLAFAMAFGMLTIAALGGVTMITRPSAVPPGCGLLQIVVFALAGVMFLAPMVAPAAIPPALVFAGIVVAFAVQTVANVIAWRRADEMMRRVMTETSTIAFWGLQSVLFLYACAERLAMIQPVSAWGMAGILMAVYLISSIIPSVRRGLA
ncbi:hypothetical protein [Brevundimonas sp. NIBR11]|uniref:hypothetical protein n=1 Tax=Brevundimonas sp. NIBR11 TaxID=3015999 RepID=UPI0022F11BFE|nr:hypothetical protein [Brevundimonas sp. NIBR11]WGM29835.1 hypothetical protein KKHFBJBL_00037 [Brevundimonas sp. NIBR11]